jgi:hypothetical protein
MLPTKADLRHSWMVNNTTTHRPNLDKTTTSPVRANCKMKFKSIKVKPSRELSNNLLKIKCGNKSIIIMGSNLILNSVIRQLWFIILILILEHILSNKKSITTVLIKNLRSKWEGITLLLVGSRSLQLIWFQIIILSNRTPTDWLWADKFCWTINFRANIILEDLVKKWKTTVVLYKSMEGQLPKQVFKLKR